jgi:hypothetical protein
MTAYILGRIFEHKNWANLQIIQACSALSDEQLDTVPKWIVLRVAIIQAFDTAPGECPSLA